MVEVGRRDLLKAAGGAGVASALPLGGSAFAARPGAALSFDIRDFGARGDGRKDTLALQQALDRCAMLGGGEVVVPPGNWLIGAIAIGAGTTLRVAEGATLLGSPDLTDYPLRQVRWEGKFVPGHIGLIHAENVEHIGIAGKGRIIGNPAIDTRIDQATGHRNPALIEFVSCRHVDIREVFTRQNAMWSIHPLFCTDVRFSDMVVEGGADGIDVDSCERVVIERCSFDTGDDCIALKSGRGEEGNRIARPTRDVRISDCSFRDAHWACIGIGSETSAGISGVLVERCRFLGAKTHAVYIKSRPGRGAFITDITMRDLEVSGVGQGFLRLNFLGSGKQDAFPVQGLAGHPHVARFAFSNVRVVGVPVLVDAREVDPERPLEGLSLSNIRGTCARGIALANIRGARLRDIAVTGYEGPLLSVYNVSGSGLAGAVPLSKPAPGEPVPVPATPYRFGQTG